MEINQLEGFPREVIEKMFERQVEQGNFCNEKVFMKNKCSNKIDNGFDWEETIEGDFFWHSVIYSNNFNLFFEKYPKEFKIEHLGQILPENSNNFWQPKRGERVLVWDDNETATSEVIFLYELTGAEHPILAVSPKHEKVYKTKPFHFVCFKHMKPIIKEEQKSDVNFKDKVIELLENKISDTQANLVLATGIKDYHAMFLWDLEEKHIQSILKQIKEL